jgi:hypothetical protein
MLTLSVIAGLLAYGVTDDGSAIAVATATVFLLTGAVFLLRVWLSSSSAVTPKEPARDERRQIGHATGINLGPRAHRPARPRRRAHARALAARHDLTGVPDLVPTLDAGRSKPAPKCTKQKPCLTLGLRPEAAGDRSSLAWQKSRAPSKSRARANIRARGQGERAFAPRARLRERIISYHSSTGEGMGRRKPTARIEFVLFNVIYEDGSQSRPTARYPAPCLAAWTGDAPARHFIEARDREIAERSGRRVRPSNPSAAWGTSRLAPRSTRSAHHLSSEGSAPMGITVSGTFSPPSSRQVHLLR